MGKKIATVMDRIPFDPVQQEIVAVLRKEGSMESGRLSERLQISESDLERELATLRHMEKIRAEPGMENG